MRRLPHKTWVLLALGILLLPAACYELAMRVLLGNRSAQQSSYITLAINHQRNQLMLRFAGRLTAMGVYVGGVGIDGLGRSEIGELRVIAAERFRMPDNRAVREEMAERYSDAFDELQREIRREGAEPILMVIPRPHTTQAVDEAQTRIERLAAELAATYDVTLWDLVPPFAAHEGESLHLMPQDQHLSPAGSRLIADWVGQHKADWLTRGHARTHRRRPSLLGDAAANEHRVAERRGVEYESVTNSQGLRLHHDLTFPKQHRRILFVGDSFTQCPGMNNEQMWTYLLAARYRDHEFIAMGRYGRTITDHLSYYRERGRYVEADVVVVQIMESDLWELLDISRRTSARSPEERVGRKLSPVEEAFMEQVRRQASPEPDRAPSGSDEPIPRPRPSH